jgi:hypothetical protein
MRAKSHSTFVRLLGTLCLGFAGLVLSAGWVHAGPIHLVLESDEDRPAGEEVFLATYGSLDDFFAGTFATAGFTDINISPGFSIAGFTFSDTGYHMLLQSDEDRPAGQEVFLATYGSLDDFFAGTFATAGFTDINISPGFRIRGFTMEFEVSDPHVRVPEPSTSSTLLIGVLVLIFARLHRSRRGRRS